jgi:GT2 family glycosyltransferase
MTDRLNSAGPRLAVVVPATDGPASLDRCLGSIAAAADGPEELIVVDQPGLTVVDARNHGALRASAEVLVFIDSDVLVHGDAFTRIRRAFSDDPHLTGVIGAYDDSPTAPGTVSGFRNLLHHSVGLSAPGPVATFWTGLGAVRNDVFEAAGGFDDTLRWPRGGSERRDFMADVSLGLRLTEAGHRIVLDPQIQGTHLKQWTLGQMIYTDFLLRGVPWVRLLLQRRHAPVHLNLGWRHRVSALVSLLAAVGLVRRRPRQSAAMAGMLVLINRRFYSLMLRRRGSLEAIPAVGVHIIHHLTSLASLCAGLAIHLARSDRNAPPSTGPIAPAAAIGEPALNGGERRELAQVLPG